LAFANKVAVNASLQDFKQSFEQIIAVEGCKTACATQLLTSMGLSAASTLHLSDKTRTDEKVGLTAQEDVEIDERVPGVVDQILALAPLPKEGQ
jgi:uncharacterized metal-binding protein